MWEFYSILALFSFLLFFSFSFLIVRLFNKSNIMGTDNSICLLEKLVGGPGRWKTRFRSRDGLCGVFFCQEMIERWCEVWHFDYRAAEELSCVEVEVKLSWLFLSSCQQETSCVGGLFRLPEYLHTME